MEDYVRARARTSSSPAATAACAPTARCARPRASTPATCSSARRCRSTSPATARRRRSAASPASAAPPTWAPTRAAGATRAPAWLKAGPRGAAGRDGAAACRAARSSWCRWSRPSASTCSRPSSRSSTPGSWPSRRGMRLPPVMIYGDDVTHIVTEEGIANLLLCRGDEEREQAIRGVAGFTPVGRGRDRRAVENLRERGVDPPPRGPRHRPPRRDAQPARGALDQGPGARSRRALRGRRARFRNW